LVFVGLDPKEDLSSDVFELLKFNCNSEVFSISLDSYKSFSSLNEQISGLHPLEESEIFMNLEGRLQNSVQSMTNSNNSLSLPFDFIPLLCSVVAISKNFLVDSNNLLSFNPNCSVKSLIPLMDSK